jgi:transcriptional regulator with XRE-family HTH domain
MSLAPRRFGYSLREWRQRRRLTQLELSNATGISARHLSFIETGRSQPSRAMILRLAEHLQVPLRDRNELLTTAGFAAVYPMRALTDPALAPALQTVEILLKAHQPYPAFAVDRHWMMVASNEGFRPFVKGIDLSRFPRPFNVLRFTLHPQGLGPRIINHWQWRAHVYANLQRQIELSDDPVLVALLDELRGYPLPDGVVASDAVNAPAMEGFAVPFQLQTEYGPLSFFSTTTIFGTPLEVTLAEFSLECFYPADAASVAILHRASGNLPPR